MREMFKGIVEPSSFRVGPRRRRTPLITFLVVCCTAFLLTSIELGQILASADLPLTPRQLIAFMPAPPLGDVQLPAPRRPTPSTARPVEAAISQVASAPIAAPDTIAPEAPDAAASQLTALPGEIAGFGASTQNLLFRAAPPPPPPPPPPVQQPAAAPKEIPRVGGTLKPPVRISNVNPRYPAAAIAARIEGVVIIEATINTEGKVVNARILRSIPLLDEAALDAVRQWEYTPSFLNGQRTPVIMTITINFTLR